MGKTVGERKKGSKKVRWFDSIIDSQMNLSKLLEIAEEEPGMPLMPPQLIVTNSQVPYLVNEYNNNVFLA